MRFSIFSSLPDSSSPISPWPPMKSPWILGRDSAKYSLLSLSSASWTHSTTSVSKLDNVAKKQTKLWICSIKLKSEHGSKFKIQTKKVTTSSAASASSNTPIATKLYNWNVIAIMYFIGSVSRLSWIMHVAPQEEQSVKPSAQSASRKLNFKIELMVLLVPVLV